MEPDIVKQLREEEKQGLLKKQEINSNNEYHNSIERLKDLELILKLQNEVVKDFLLKIKQGKIKTTQYVILSLNELLNYYNSEYWKVTSNNISIDKHILSFIHLVNTYIEHLEQSSVKEESAIDKNTNSNDIMKLKNIKLSLNTLIQ
ncbi:MAG: hypothetical protein JSU91_03640 [Thermoplasmatales archaeon]|nr:MAG: hypothetical protein JSU91_03640 [Thermoplasmatales archaeon]